MQVNVRKTARYGGRSLRTLGCHTWNPLAQLLKAETNLIQTIKKPMDWTN